MKIIEPSVKFIDKIDPEAIMTKLEACARTCYQSEGKADPEKKTADKLLANCIKSGHTSILEHVSLTAEIVTDRGTLGELTRHRIGCSYSVESTRYCNYGKMGITFIRPIEYDERDIKDPVEKSKAIDRFFIWRRGCEDAKYNYEELLEAGATPQEARSVLNNSLKCTMKVTMNIRAWRHFLELRCAPNAHPHIKQIAIPILFHLTRLLPVLFSDIEYDKEFVRKYTWNLRDISIHMLDNDGPQLNRKIAENSKVSDDSIHLEKDEGKKESIKDEKKQKHNQSKDTKCYHYEKLQRINTRLNNETKRIDGYIKNAEKATEMTKEDRDDLMNDIKVYLKELFGEDVDVLAISKIDSDRFLKSLLNDEDD